MAPSRHRAVLPAIVLVLAVRTAGADAPATTDGFRALRDAVEAAAIDAPEARSVGRTKLAAGPATLEIRGGVVYPAAAADGRVTEIVFLGRARFVVDPDDRVERDQLELFTGAPRLDATITRAVLVLANDDALAALLSGPLLPEPDPAREGSAREALTTWRASRERRRRGVAAAMLANVVEGPARGGYFAAWMHDELLGDFLYTVDPDRQQKANVVQFVPFEIPELERQEAITQIRGDQKKGRFKDLDPEDLLGDWNVWFSTAPSGPAGAAGEDAGPFRPVRYALDVSIDRFPLEVRVVTRIDAEAVAGDRRIVSVELSPDVEVLGAKDAAGKPLPFLRVGDVALVVLDGAPKAGAACSVVVETLGRVIDDTGQGTWALRDTVNWHPRIDYPARATWDASFVLPKGFDLVGSGRVVETGTRDGRPFQRRVLDTPTLGFSFEIGNFRSETTRVGHVELTFAFDTLTRISTELPREDVVKTAVDALRFYEETFGPYPLDTMTVVTTQRSFSQGLLGFLSLAADELTTEDDVRRFRHQRDARTVLAHEIAHQWWGGVVGWRSERDQWISEAMATYAANLFTRRRMPFGGQGQVRISETAGWWHALEETSDRGVPVDELGPVVLGTRLVSSLDEDAYHAIVYLKGAVVFETLSRYFRTEDAFVESLRAVVEDCRGTLISTEEFLDRLGHRARLDLRPFAERFVFGTGLPAVTYRFDFEKAGTGWSVRGVATKIVPAKTRFRVVRLPDGRFDIARTVTPLMDVDALPFVLPSKIGIVRPTEPPPKKNAATAMDRSNATVDGRFVLEGRQAAFRIQTEDEPRGAWLDLNREVYLTAVDETYFPKRAFYLQGLDAWARGDLAAAEKAFRDALAATGDVPDDRPRPVEAREFEKQEIRAVDLRAAAALAHLLMDRGELEEAATWVARATTIDGYLVRLARRDILVTNARFDILKGKPADALSMLKREIFAPLRLDVLYAGRTKGNQEMARMERNAPLKDPAAFALAAIAAKQTGDVETFARVVKSARRFGVDVAALEN